jgi:hypothetical protein
VVHLPVAMDTHPFVDELGVLEVGVLEHRHCHRRPRTLKLKPRKEKLNNSWSKTSLSRRSHHHPTWWTCWLFILS